MTKWLLFDADGLSHRAYHAMGGANLNYKQIPTSVIYNFLGSVLNIQGQFSTQQQVFAFDSRQNKRKEIAKTYKLKRSQAREEWDEDEKARFKIMCKQRKLLRTKILREMGFQNVFQHRGYEADDVLASVCQSISKKDAAVIVTDDKDMYQLLSKKVSVWRPRSKELWTKERFKKVYGIKPRDWVLVKALAGCTSDEVQGIKGVAEKSVCQYLTGQLVKGARYDLIVNNMKKMLKRNRPLVDLPFEGCKEFEIKKDKKIDWGYLREKYGIKTLAPIESVFQRRPKLIN